MKFRILFLYLINLLILIVSLGTLACHIAQLVLLSKVADAGKWWPSYKPYIFYYVGSIVSILSSTLLILFSCFSLKSIWIHRIIATINLSLTTAFVVYISLESGVIPWSNSNTRSTNVKGFATYCSSYYNDDHTTFIRCWLVNGSWLGMVIYGFFWLLSVLYFMILKKSDLNEDDYDIYDYKNDVPMVMNAPDPSHRDTYYYEPTGHEYSRDSYYGPRRLSKTLLRDTSTMSPPQSTSSQQPPHSYEGL